ncbi:MAG TPA: TadE family protein [Terriglobia bacterium]|nr:TadE family protein [Terriglobia bacterium]
MTRPFRNEEIVTNSRAVASEPGERRTVCANARRGRLRARLRGTEGAELLEFAMALPLLLVLVVGIIDFAQAYNTKHITSNAAREAARLISSTPLSDSACPTAWTINSPGSGTPCAVLATATTVANYLTAAGLSQGACLTTATASFAPVLTWTYSCNNVTLTIYKIYDVANPSDAASPIKSTKVTLSYPYTFMFGRIISLLLPGATGPTGQYIFTSDAVMQNITFAN